jgi:hypothetical protein
MKQELLELQAAALQVGEFVTVSQQEQVLQLVRWQRWLHLQ